MDVWFLKEDKDVKLKGKEDDSDASDRKGEDDESIDLTSVPVSNRKCDMKVLNENVSSQLVCKYYGHDVTLMETRRQGLDSQLVFHCSNRHCTDTIYFHTSKQISIGNLAVSSVNRRSVFAMRTIGYDRADLVRFCGVTDLPPPVEKDFYNKVNKTKKKR